MNKVLRRVIALIPAVLIQLLWLYVLMRWRPMRLLSIFCCPLFYTPYLMLGDSLMDAFV